MRSRQNLRRDSAPQGLSPQHAIQTTLGDVRAHLGAYEGMRKLGFDPRRRERERIGGLHIAAGSLIDACAAQVGVHIGMWKKTFRKLRWNKRILGPATAGVLQAYEALSDLSGNATPDLARALALFGQIESECQKVIAHARSAGTLDIPKGLVPAEWLRGFAQFYRELGFFAGEPSDERVAEALRERADALYEERQRGGRPQWYPEVSLLSEDEDRVWWGHLEADVGAGSRSYIEALGTWARISRGQFQPSELAETWEGEQGPVHLRLSLAGKARELSPRFLEDYLDTGILVDINGMIGDPAPKFWMFDDGGFFVEDVVVAVLTEEERDRIERERGLKFLPPSR